MMDRTRAKIGRSIKNFEKSMICLRVYLRAS
jgi:hypothetical protein